LALIDKIQSVVFLFGLLTGVSLAHAAEARAEHPAPTLASDTPLACGPALLAQTDVALSQETDTGQQFDISGLVSMHLARPEAVDAIKVIPVQGTSLGDTWRLADIAFVPEMLSAALSSMQRDYATFTRMRAKISDQPHPASSSRDATGSAKAAGKETVKNLRVAALMPPAAIFFDRNGRSWQEVLLRAGVAMLLPDPVPDKDTKAATSQGSSERRLWSRTRWINRLARAEQAAMNAHQGMWGKAGYHFAANRDARTDHTRSYSDSDHNGLPNLPDARKAIGKFAVVDGKVVSVEQRKWRTYLNFGQNWRHDFTIALGADQIKTLADNGIKPEDFIGQTLRARGVIDNRGGPYVELSTLDWLCRFQARGR
jgi:hypothetical protein